MLIDTHLDATPSDITASATAIGNVTSHVDGAEDDLISACTSVCELEGSSAIAASGWISTSVTDCENLVTELGSYKTALDNLASALSSIKTDLQGIRDQATAGGLTLNGETVVEPKSSYPLGANHDSSVEVYENSEVFSPDAFVEGEDDQGCGGDRGDGSGIEGDVLEGLEVLDQGVGPLGGSPH